MFKRSKPRSKERKTSLNYAPKILTEIFYNTWPANGKNIKLHLIRINK